MSQRRYTTHERAKAVAEALVKNSTVVSEETGIPESTIRWWMRQPQFAEMRSRARDDVAEEVWTYIQVGLRRIAELIPLSEDLQKVATTVGILYDKHALLTGSATSRTESRDITGSLSDADLISAIREAESVATGGGGPRPVEDPPAG